MKTKRSLGQHFLKSERALTTTIEAGSLSARDVVLEIGPGQGALTEKLLATNCQVLAVEKDDSLYEALKIKFQKEIVSRKLILIHDDILNFKLKIENYKLIANIPYNITGAILKKFLSANYQPNKIVILVQKEVAERIIAKKKPLDSARGKESILSISVKAYGTPKYVETVKAGSFVPRPKIDSAIIAIDNISKDFFNGDPTNCGRVASTVGGGFSEEKFFQLLRAGFKSKRKKLSSNLSMIFEKDQILKVFKELGLDSNLRAEDVRIETWQKLAQNLLAK